jgi:hypothetical protein
MVLDGSSASRVRNGVVVLDYAENHGRSNRDWRRKWGRIHAGANVLAMGMEGYRRATGRAS